MSSSPPDPPPPPLLSPASLSLVSPCPVPMPTLSSCSPVPLFHYPHIPLSSHRRSDDPQRPPARPHRPSPLVVRRVGVDVRLAPRPQRRRSAVHVPRPGGAVHGGIRRQRRDVRRRLLREHAVPVPAARHALRTVKRHLR